MTRRSSVGAVGVAALAAVAGLAACSGASAGKGLPAAQVSQRYEAAMGPANSALTAFVSQAVAVGAGAPGNLSSGSQRTAGALRKASGEVGAITGAPAIQRDMADVVKSLDVLVTELTSLSSAKGSDVPPAVARVVADAGREAAADELVKLALIAATTPTTEPPPTLEPPTTATTTTIAPVTTPRRTTTTRPRTTTTVARTTTTTIKH